MNFDRRADLSELMDEPCSYQNFRDCLRDLAQVNRLTLAYRPTLQWLQARLQTSSSPVHIVDVGCGGGDMLHTIVRWASRRGVAVRLTGIDLNPYAARAAQELLGTETGIEWLTCDAYSYQPDVPVDFVICSLFTHHLPDDEIIRFLQWMEVIAKQGWFINDLHRERIPYVAFQALASVMRWHHFVRYDGPVSIRRSFQPADWERYLQRASIASSDVSISAFRPARLCVSRVKR